MLGNFWQGTDSMLAVLKNVIQILRNALTLKVITVFDSLQRFRSSRPELFCKKGVLIYFPKFTGKHLYQSLFLNKVADLRPGGCF